MTAIDRHGLKPGDKVRYSREGVVHRVGHRTTVLLDSGYYHTPDDVLGDWTFELLERPLPEEPPVGSVVIFRYDGHALEAWKRWHGHLGWLHAGNSTPRNVDRSPQGRSWAQLLEGSDKAERTVIEP